MRPLVVTLAVLAAAAVPGLAEAAPAAAPGTTPAVDCHNSVVGHCIPHVPCFAILCVLGSAAPGPALPDPAAECHLHAVGQCVPHLPAPSDLIPGL